MSTDPGDHDETVRTHSANAPATTRRQLLGYGTGLAALAASGLDRVAPAGASDAGALPRLELSFDEGWLFHRGDVAGAQATGFADTGWRKLDLPHDWRIEDLPYATSDDGGATADPSGFAFETRPSPDGTAPDVIGPFDVNADPVPDLDITIPGFGRVVFPGGRNQGYTVAGVGWYRKRFVLPDFPGQRTEIRFDGIFQNSDVWLNGRHLGFHPNGYTSFAYDLGPFLDPDGENVLAVRVDNSGKTSRWYSGSGIYRHTWLTLTGPVRVPLWGVQVTTPVVAEARSVANVAVQLSNTGPATSVGLRLTVLNAAGRPVATQTVAPQRIVAGGTATATATIAIPGAALWSPESPSLYSLCTEVLLGLLVVDRVTTSFGIRSLSFSGSQGFLLNGRPYTLHGGNLHHDHGPLGTVAIDRAEERTVATMKAAGLNIIRGSHNPRSPALLDACDRLGMLVYDEFTDMWDVGKSANDYHVYFPTWWQRDLAGMVTRDRNHPSVIMWSIGNEIASDANNYGPRLAALVRSLDTTRPVVQGGQNVGNTPNAFGYVDVCDYHGTPPASDLAAHPDKAFLQSEDLSSQIYDDWALAQTTKQYIGSITWCGWDYLGESGAGATLVYDNLADAEAHSFDPAIGKIPYPWMSNFQSEIDIIGQRKPQNYYRAVVNGFSPLELMVVRPTPPGLQQFNEAYSFYDELQSWSWDVPAGQAMTVHVYTRGDSVSLLLDGQLVQTQALTDADKCLATFSVPYAAGALTAVASRNGTVIGRRTLQTVGQPAAIRLSPDVAGLTTSRADLAHVLVEIVDAQNRLVPDAVAKVSFSAGGAGSLIGVGNGNPHNVDSFQRPRRWTWHGQALAILRPAKLPGRVWLAASADGLRPARIELPVAPAWPF